MEDLHEACQRRARLAKPPLTPEQNQRYDLKQLESGIERLELLLPGFSINIEQLSALQWADLVTDTNGVAAKLVALKGCYPNLDLVDLLQKYPKVLTLEPQELRENAYKVMELLQGAKNPEAIIQAVPELITPKILASVIITINKWYQLERDPIEVLENDPDIVRRAQVKEKERDVWGRETGETKVTVFCLTCCETGCRVLPGKRWHRCGTPLRLLV